MRTGTWILKIHSSLPRILEAIYYWCEGLNARQVEKFTGVTGKQYRLISRGCRLTAAHFITRNHCLNRVGGLDAHGNPKVVLIDETHTGKMKFHRGAPKVTLWVVGGVEQPAECDPPQKIPKFFAMTVPD